MAHQHVAFQIDDTTLARIWSAQGLGQVHSSDWAGYGVNNPSFMVNDTTVIRFDGLITEGVSRFHGERAAYQLMREAGIPCPQVIAIDDSKSLVPYTYMIMTRMEGTPVIHSWSQLTADQQKSVAYEAGQLLAQIHQIRLPQFGRLYGTEWVFDHWYDYVLDTFERYSQQALANGLITQALDARMRAVIVHHRPMLEVIREPCLVHWDYHFGNLLQQDGKITAVLDLEWALGGDASHDFNRRDEWEEQCPGSAAWVYEGYRSLRTLPNDHEARVVLYEMLWFLDCVIDAPNIAEADLMRERVVRCVKWLEENG